MIWIVRVHGGVPQKTSKSRCIKVYDDISAIYWRIFNPIPDLKSSWKELSFDTDLAIPKYRCHMWTASNISLNTHNFRLAINSKCDEILKWIDANQLAKADDFKDKQKEAEGIFNPIITGARSRTKVICWFKSPEILTIIDLVNWSTLLFWSTSEL